jgi:2,5-furandicarboxylate decarboxylase 1
MYEKMDKPMPVAVVIGHHPVYDLVATYCTSYGVDEYELAGPILGETVERVECETVDLEVPAHAEIVIEGEIPPHVREEEGPFGEFQGYYSGGMGMNPIIKVTAITMRHDAIYRHVEAGKPPSEHQTWAGLPLEAELYKRIKDVGGFIDVKDVHIPHYGGLFTAVAKITPHYEGEAKNVLLAMMSTSYLHPKVCIVVDDDVDIYDPADIMWAISTRVNPETDVIIIPRTRMHPLDISATQISPPGTRWQRLAAKIGIDATKPSTWAEKERELFKRVYPKGWGKYKLEDFL